MALLQAAVPREPFPLRRASSANGKPFGDVRAPCLCRMRFCVGRRRGTRASRPASMAECAGAPRQWLVSTMAW